MHARPTGCEVRGDLRACDHPDIPCLVWATTGALHLAFLSGPKASSPSPSSRAQDMIQSLLSKTVQKSLRNPLEDGYMSQLKAAQHSLNTTLNPGQAPTSTGNPVFSQLSRLGLRCPSADVADSHRLPDPARLCPPPRGSGLLGHLYDAPSPCTARG